MFFSSSGYFCLSLILQTLYTDASSIWVDVRSLHCQYKCVRPLLSLKLTQIILRDRTARTFLCSSQKQPLSSAADLGGYSDKWFCWILLPEVKYKVWCFICLEIWLSHLLSNLPPAQWDVITDIIAYIKHETAQGFWTSISTTRDYIDIVKLINTMQWVSSFLLLALCLKSYLKCLIYVVVFANIISVF